MKYESVLIITVKDRKKQAYIYLKNGTNLTPNNIVDIDISEDPKEFLDFGMEDECKRPDVRIPLS